MTRRTLSHNIQNILMCTAVILTVSTYDIGPALAAPNPIQQKQVQTKFDVFPLKPKSSPFLLFPQFVQEHKETPKLKHVNYLAQITPENVTNINLTQPSGLTVEDANTLLKGTGLEGLGPVYIEAEHEYHVNALYLIAHSALESGWGTSPLAVNKNNLFGVDAYDSNPYTDAKCFPSKADCILFTAQLVSEKYLNPKGVYHNGTSVDSMSPHYATDKYWADKIGEIMIESKQKVIEARQDNYQPVMKNSQD